MLSEGKVISADKNIAAVKVIRKSACGENCASCKGCAENTVTVNAVNSVNAKPGDEVAVESSSSSVLLTAFAVYIVPLIVFIASYFIFDKYGEGIAALISVVFFLASFIAVKFFYRKPPEVRIVRIIKEASEEENV